MRRRDFLGVLTGAAIAKPRVAFSQRSEIPTIGFLSPQADSVNYVDGLPTGLRELGYVNGRNIRIETRWAHGKLEQLAELASELVDLKVDVLVTSLTQASLVARKATSTIPIVMAGVADPVSVGLIASLARPGGNVTGTSAISADIVGKQLELLREIVPGAPRVAALWNPTNSAFQKLQLEQLRSAARTLGVELQLLEVRVPSDFDTAFAAISKERTPALAVLGDPLFSLHSTAIAGMALKNRLPTVSPGRVFANAGMLLAYGPDYFELHKRAAAYVDKILKGANPADLPVEQPTTFELIINLKTAKALGLDVPPALLARADATIE